MLCYLTHLLIILDQSLWWKKDITYYMMTDVEFQNEKQCLSKSKYQNCSSSCALEKMANHLKTL